MGKTKTEKGRVIDDAFRREAVRASSIALNSWLPRTKTWKRNYCGCAARTNFCGQKGIS